jgi:hypothetical protein
MNVYIPAYIHMYTYVVLQQYVIWCTSVLTLVFCPSCDISLLAILHPRVQWSRWDNESADRLSRDSSMQHNISVYGHHTLLRDKCPELYFRAHDTKWQANERSSLDKSGHKSNDVLNVLKC